MGARPPLFRPAWHRVPGWAHRGTNLSCKQRLSGGTCPTRGAVRGSRKPEREAEDRRAGAGVLRPRGWIAQRHRFGGPVPLKRRDI